MGAAGARGGGGRSNQVCSSSPGIETSPHAVSVLARPSAESAIPPLGRSRLLVDGRKRLGLRPRRHFWSPSLPQQEILNWPIRTVWVCILSCLMFCCAHPNRAGLSAGWMVDMNHPSPIHHHTVHCQNGLTVSIV